MKKFNSLFFVLFAFILTFPVFAGDKGYVGEEGTEIEVTRVSNPLLNTHVVQLDLA